MTTRRHNNITKSAATLLLLLLLTVGSMADQAWAAGYKVTYHILTLPIAPTRYDYHMKSDINGKRLEAIRVIVDDATTVGLPAHFKSPLAKNFKYWDASSFTQTTKQDLYAGKTRKSDYYTAEDTQINLTEGAALASDCHIYVTYEYNDENSIAKLDGLVAYNIPVDGGFLAYNRGRNNRIAVIPTEYVQAEHLISEDFIKVNVSGLNTYYNGNNDWTSSDAIGSQYHFQFKFEGSDPYNIIIRTAYSGTKSFVEGKRYKYYAGGAIFAKQDANVYLTSDDHREYTSVFSKKGEAAPATLTYTNTTGYFHNEGNYIWGTFAILNNTNTPSDGYVFAATRTIGNTDAMSDPTKSGGSYQYYYLRDYDKNTFSINKETPESATSKFSTGEAFYTIKDVYFKVRTPFGNDASSSIKLSQYSINNNDISLDNVPSALRRKYCSFTGRFYKDAACTQAITKYSEMENNTVYVGYQVSENIPFQAITPAASYSDDTWNAATWYELTDADSEEANGKKLKYTSPNFKNDGASGTFEKTTEYAFIGDPYELRVVLRSATTGATATYVGAATASDGTSLTASTTASDGYRWEIPNDDTSGSFELRQMNGSGKWYWGAASRSVDVTYGTDKALDGGTEAKLSSNAQTVTFNVTGLTDGENYYITVTKGGTDAGQVTVSSEKIYVQQGGKATFTVTVANNADSEKTFTLSVQEYNSSDATQGTASVITITQSTTADTGNLVQYSTSSSTRVKLLTLPTRTFTYKIVDKAGNIAVKASAEQTIFSPLSLASIPSIIVSPFLVGETVTFYDSYTDRNSDGELTRLDFHNPSEQTNITETPNADHDIFVTYTTPGLSAKPITLSQDQEFSVKLNDEVLYYDDNKIKSTPTSSDLSQRKYLWKLRGQDPYAMLIDNLGARDDKSVSGNETPDVYDDSGAITTPEREKGAWIEVASVVNVGALSITTDRTAAQRFIAKSSTQGGVYEVMVATGDGVDASTTYYNIGNEGTTEIKIYANTAYAHGSNELKFVLEQQTGYTYHLIDKAKHELLTVMSNSPDLVLPAEYQSPMVATYSYYAKDQMTINDKGTTDDKSDDEYTPTDADTKLSAISELFAVYTSTDITSAEYTGSLTANDESDLTAKARALTATGTYYYKVGKAAPYTYKQIVVTTASRGLDIYVTYEKNDLVKFNDSSSPYLLKFLDPLAEGYYLEDGNDALTTEKIQAVYPYCNGDGNLNIYGTAMNEEQMGGGASTRPRWVWFFESGNSDPYHVKIHSRSTISFNGVSHPTYLQTEAIHFNQDADASTKHLVTRGTLPGIASTQATEYMILGTQGHYKLRTTNEVDGARRDVTSFEQYWKTYNMIKLAVLGVSASTDAFSNDESTWVVPTTDDPETVGVDESTYRTTLAERGWHSYDAIASAVRWNGYNNVSTGHTSKVVEKLEHWFQTFDMGDGTFDIVSADIPPVLVLLDRHGWEIMRKPLPKNHYPYGEELDALKVYDSPMVKEYKFYSNATKASGCHKYTLRMQNGAERDQIKVNGVHYTSTSLADLPPRTASGVISSGAFNDQFVTYTVKDEFDEGYKYTLTLDEENFTYTETASSTDYLYLQNQRFAKEVNNNEAYLSKPIREATNPIGGGAYDMLLYPQTATVANVSTSVDDNKDGRIDDENLWYVRPNLDIDNEMGIPWGTSNDITAAEPLSEYATKKKYKDQTGFDPYNLQISRKTDGKLFTIQLTAAQLVNGSWVGTLSDTGLRLETSKSTTGYVEANGYDHTTLKMTNQTFMAVQDAMGNMQLMPRFDHTRRVNVDYKNPYHTTLVEPVNHTQKATAENNESMGAQTVFFVRPQRFVYHIIDNDGYEALRYKSACESSPTVPDFFASPLAKDFKFYKAATTDPDSTKYIINSADEITSSFVHAFAGADLDALEKDVYVRYSYDDEADYLGILKGRWLTAQLDDKDMVASGTVVTTSGSEGTGVSFYQGDSKPETIDADDKTWQWKFLQSPDPSSALYEHPDPDPYAVHIFNRNANNSSSASATPIKVTGKDRFALLNHSSGGYALATAGLKTFNYSYLNGASMTVPSTTAASIVVEGSTVKKTLAAKDHVYSDAEILSALGSADGVYYVRIPGTAVLYGTLYSYEKVTISGGSVTSRVTITKEEWQNVLSEGTKLTLTDDITHEYTYRVINNADTLAVSATQTNEEAVDNEFAPVLPEAAQTPLLNLTDYKYYGSATKDDKETDDPNDDTYSAVTDTKLFTLYGLYDDVVYVRYDAYDMDKTPYKVPNVKGDEDGHVARGSASTDAAISINDELPYNIIWYNDNMMSATTSEGTTTISDGGSQTELHGGEHYVWRFCGNDPYALKIKHKASGKYIDGTATLVAEGSAKNFMLLKKEGYDYGILQETGGTNRLSGYGQTTTTGDPTKFIIFGLPVHDLIYHLIIAKTCADHESPNTGEYVDIPYMTTESGTLTTKRIYGTTQRDLTSENTGEGTHYAGEKYQLGETISYGDESHVYCYDAGKVTVGDVLQVPSVFERPNCRYFYYVEGIYDGGLTTPDATLNNKYKGLELTRLPKDDDLVDTYVVINVAYAFDTGPETNVGDGFVTSVGQNLWYTVESSDATPWLAHFNYGSGSIAAMQERDPHYTNDFLWTPLGDVYGFKMYNRYVHKNVGETSFVMTTTATPADGVSLTLESNDNATYAANAIYELYAGDTDGYFLMRPMLNTNVAIYNNAGTITLSSSNATEWTFGLNEAQFKPYYDRAGYVGGLTTAGKAAYTAAGSNLQTKQGIVYNDANIVSFSPGYYRLHSLPNADGITTPRYLSGYTHATEGTYVTGGIPMHFYSRKGVSTTYTGEGGLASGFTVSPATRGELPVPATEYDPSSVFYLSGSADGTTMQTQGLNVTGNTMGEGTGTSFRVTDLGGAVVLLNDASATPSSRQYLYFNGTTATRYDIGYDTMDGAGYSIIDKSKWCMQPVQKSATAGDGEMPLMISTNNGGDGYYYATFYAPFDVLLPADASGKTYYAYVCDKWSDTNLHPTKVPETASYAAGKFVPAGTPVIIRVKDESGSMMLTLPNTTPSAKLENNIFSGTYLEQMLGTGSDVYTMGLPFTSDVSKASDYSSTGNIEAPLPEQANNGLGFYINATPNKEASGTQSLWTRNNRYVLHNKIYYRAPAGGSSAREDGMGDMPQFVPVIFDDGEGEGELLPDGSWQSVAGDGCVYDLSGRRVADEQQVRDGSWRRCLRPGIYIVGGKKGVVDR